MSKTITPSRALRDLADDARVLMEATATATGDHVAKARKRLAAALEHEKATGEDVATVSADRVPDPMEKLCDRFTVALNHGKDMYDQVRDDVVRRTQAADHAVRENPYRTMGIALSVGAIVGCILSSRHSRNGHCGCVSV